MKQLCIILIWVLAVRQSFAGVDPRHGVFYISYTDIEFTGTGADISRSYNSTRSTTGLFGYGWASLLETKLSALPDGSLSLGWWGNAGDYYEPAVVDREGLFAMVNAIIRELIKNHKLDNNPAAIAEKKSYYLVNNQERAKKYVELIDKKLVRAFIPSKKQKWILDVNQVIEWTGSAYKVKSWQDHYEFDNIGQLVLIKDRNYNMRLSYLGNKLSKIIVNDSSVCNIRTNEKGRIIELTSFVEGKEKKAIYKYDSTDNLLYSKDAGDNEYWYSYDLYHNMVKINYVDTTSLEITYDGAANRVIKLKDQKGFYSTYQYPYFYTEEGRINYDHYATRIQRYDSSGKMIFNDYKEYENRTKDDGSTYLYRILETSDTSYHEVLYDSEVGNARYRKKNNHEAWSRYDSKRRPVYLRLKDSIYQATYNTEGLPVFFSQIDSVTNTGINYQYRYNVNGELSEVTRNNVRFRIDHPKEKNTIEIQKDDGNKLVIQQMPDSNYILVANNDHRLGLNKEEWKKMNDSIAVKLPVGKLMNKVEVQLNSEKQEAELKKDPLALYFEFYDILLPKKIEHEWIWQRL